MKKMIPLFLCIVAFLIFWGYTPRTGVVKNVKVEQVDSDIYSEEDINEAIEVVEEYFVKYFDGCRLEKIAYAGDEEQRFMHSENGDEVITLISDFYVYPRGGGYSFNSNDTYTDWFWILERKPNGKWEHKDHGYG